MNLNLFDSLQNRLLKWGFHALGAEILSSILIGAGILLLATLAGLLTFKIFYRILEKMLRHTRLAWAEELLNRKVFHRLAWLAPALVLRSFSSGFLDNETSLANIIRISTNVMMIASVTLAFIAFLDCVNSIYSRRKEAVRRPIKGMVQATQVLCIIAGLLFAFSLLIHKPIDGLLTGIGAISAVLMLIFRDPIMGLVSGFQISSNDILRIGDWVEMPSHGADGEVIDISLLNVTVRNWDKNYVMLPIQVFTSGAFKNWRGMADCGGRRIKRSLFIDLSTIHFLDEEEIDHLASISLIKDFIENRRNEILSYNKETGANRNENPVNGRALTNIGVFRRYALSYLQNHGKVSKNLTLMVRQLQSGPEGLPLEFYFFTNDIEWTTYEEIQSDIFDHIFASLEEFGLKVFQKPGAVIQAEIAVKDVKES